MLRVVYKAAIRYNNSTKKYLYNQNTAGTADYRLCKECEIWGIRMLSVCIITKNEEKNIEVCLKALAGYGWELVVVDTGSTDRTCEIASRYTNTLYHCSWQDDFALAKNYAAGKASHDYVMFIDSDEILEKPELAELKALEKLIEAHPDEVGRIRRKNIFSSKDGKQENQEWINRIFLRTKFHYVGRIHEQIMAIDGSDYKTYQTPLVLDHTGYDLGPEEKKKKALRNIRLLKQELNELESGREEDRNENERQLPYLLYQLGKGYYMAEDYDKACEYFSKGLSFDLNPGLEYVIDMVETYGYALLNSGRAEEALFFQNIYDEFGYNADFQFLMGLIYMNNMKFDKAICEFQKAAGHKECRTVGTNNWLAYYNIGVIYECLGQKEKAAGWYRKCRNYPLALQRLEEIRNSR